MSSCVDARTYKSVPSKNLSTMSLPSNVISDEDDKFHLGHYVLKSMTTDPDFICQIDAGTGTGEKETRRSVLTRSIVLAKCLRRLGLKPGDVVALGGNNHLDLYIPFYAALMNGLPVAGVDPYYKLDEIKHSFKLIKPRIAFCQRKTLGDFRRAVEELGLDTILVSFDGDSNTMADLIEDCDKESIENFEIADFDTEKVYAWLISTSGSTGLAKVAAFKHKTVIAVLKFFEIFKRKTLAPMLNLSAVQWVSAFTYAASAAALNQIRVQTSAPATVEHVIDIINEYRPISTLSTPSLLYRILKHEKPCDLTCFDNILVTGASVYVSFLNDLRAAVRPDARVLEVYAQTECIGPVLLPEPLGPLGNCGRGMPNQKVKLVDPVTEEEITEPDVPGELWFKGQRFTEYYGNPEETAKAITPDGWYKTGDLLRRDQNGYFFFVERLKMLIKFRSYHVVPVELEQVISQHEGVSEVCVTGIDNPVDGEWPAAAVVRAPGAAVTAQEIEQLVADKLSEHKQLRGGVFFVDALPMTSTGKVARNKVRQMVASLHK